MSEPWLRAGHELAWAARQFGDRACVVLGARRYGYREIERRTNRLANALRGLGLATGDRVAVLLHNSVQSVETVIAMIKAGLAYVALNARHAQAEHAEILRDARAGALIAGAEFAETALRMRDLVPSLRHVIGVDWKEAGTHGYEALLERASDAAPCIRVRPDDLTRIVYTSGTTGKPKGIAYSYGRFRERTNNFFAALEYRLGVDDSMIHVGPLTHAAGNYLLPNYLRGARNIVMSRFDVEEMQEIVERERVTHLLLVPVMLGRLLDAVEAGRRRDLSSLARINYGTAPTPVALIRRGIERFGPIFRQHYGMSEAPQPLTVLYPHEHVTDGDPRWVARLASCGRPTMNVDIVVRRPDGTTAAEGEVGEITLAARGVAALQYWQRPGLLEETVRDGWLYSGDLGRMDEDGYLFIVGRSKDMIISGGFNVYAREVEDALHGDPDLTDAAVVGVPDREWGEAVAAFVVPRAGCAPSAQSIAARCAESIAGYKKPRIVEFVAELPRNAAGKVDKAKLRQAYLARVGTAEGAVPAALYDTPRNSSAAP